jgi:basic membrane protein A
MKKLTAILSMLVIAGLVLAACTPAAEEAPAAAEPAAEEPAEALRVAVVMPSAINDLAFSQSMYGALVRMQEERGADNFEIAYSEGMFKVDEAAAALRDYAAEGFDLVIAHGSQYGASLQEIAPDFPETSFAWGTTADTFGVPNIFAYEARSEEGGYVNGVLAASLSESGIIGVVGPIEVGDAKLYVDGFTAGAEATNPDVQVNANWIGSFSDVALASEAAQTHLNAGADVLTGTAQMVVGAIGVAETNGVIWLGTQSDQSSLAPSIVAANQVYDWTVALEEIVALIGEGTLGGKSFAATMSNGGLRVDFNPDFAMAGDAKAAAEAALADVTSGDIDALAAAGEVAAAKAAFKAAFVYVAPIGDLGWTWAHDQARQQMEADLGIETAYIEMVPEGPEGERVIRDFAMKGYDLIFTTSFGYMDPTITVAEEFPDIQFVHISGFKSAPNASNVFGRMYQPRYLSGLVAGAATESNIIGYVAAFPIPEVIRGINAFTRGVREVNPSAEVRVVWTNTWFGPPEEKEAADALLAAGADIIAQHQDTTEPQKAAADAGALSIGYDSDMAQFVGDTVLTSPIWNWGVKYVEIAEQVMAGTYDGSESYWGGMSEGVVALAPLSDRVSTDTAALVDEKSAAIVSGDWDVFCGPVVGANGSLVVAEGDCLDDGSMLGMDYWVEGVSGEVPGEAAGEPRALRILEWSGYEIHDWPDFFPQFAEKYGEYTEDWTWESAGNVDIEYKIFADDAESLATLAAGYAADLAHPCVNWVELYVNRDLLQPIDTTRLTHWDSIHESFREASMHNGEVYFVPWDWGYESIIVRNDLVGEVPDSWASLWDPQYAQQVITWDNDEQAFVIAALVLGIEDPWNTTEAENEAIKQKLIELQDNLLTYWVDYQENIDLLSSGDAVLGGGIWQDSYGVLLDEGYDVSYIDPVEGRTGWLCGYVLSAEAENVDLAYDFFNAATSPESTANLGIYYYYGGANPEGVDLMKEWEDGAYQYIVDYFQLDQFDDIAERTVWYKTMTEEKRQMLADMWAEVRGSY